MHFYLRIYLTKIRSLPLSCIKLPVKQFISVKICIGRMSSATCSVVQCRLQWNIVAVLTKKIPEEIRVLRNFFGVASLTHGKVSFVLVLFRLDFQQR